MRTSCFTYCEYYCFRSQGLNFSSSVSESGQEALGESNFGKDVQMWQFVYLLEQS
jgi:hypothetical protein